MVNAELYCASQKAAGFVSCIEEAVGDGIKFDFASQMLKTDNSRPTRIWDILNTRLYDTMNGLDCVADLTKRGSWKMIPVFDNESGILYTLMREGRFIEIGREHKKGGNKNYYVTQLVSSLNADLISTQMKLYQPDTPDMELMKKTIQKIISDLGIEGGSVKRHALILFESKNFELYSVRAAMIDSCMEVVEEENWDKYIQRKESTVMDSTSDYSPAANNPSRGLELTGKAAERKNRNLRHKKTSREDNID